MNMHIRRFTTSLLLGMACAAALAAGPATEGEVRKIAAAQQKITLKHGEIKNLDMPPMTMVFVAAQTAMLDRVKVGEKVRFRARDEGGKLVVTEIEALR